MSDIEMKDVTGKPRSVEDIKAALKFVEAEMLANPMHMGPKDTGPAIVHYLVIREILQAMVGP